jgi:UDP-2-acetamido-3-amino-2,3-dideoxy-glucuronate N-acetyltransferase
LFSEGCKPHLVSWLHPLKEQRLVVVGSEKMAVFDDTAEHKLVLYPTRLSGELDTDGVKASGEVVDLGAASRP